MYGIPCHMPYNFIKMLSIAAIKCLNLLNFDVEKPFSSTKVHFWYGVPASALNI